MMLRLMSYVRQLFGSRVTHEGVALLDPAYSGTGPEPRRAERPPDGYAYVHLFAAKFDSEEDARKFCYETPTKNTPEQITQELSGAFIDPNHVEVIFGDIGLRLDEFMKDGDSIQVMMSLGSANTIILIAEDAFGGFPFVVHNTQTLTHLGQFTVPV